mmetsp:Transcript_20395/g.40114  ORF Transcript_20395/g.40114 Transcript_20395/m.40114 type:complete len:619 (-) Transcript_20395:344-2200(-)
MDEIQDCIADAQFGEVLRGRETTRPNARITTPPPDFDPMEFAQERKMDMSFCVTHPVGVYILSREFPESKPIYKFLEALHDLKKLDYPSVEEYLQMLDVARQLPEDYRVQVRDLATTVTTLVLPHLQSTPNMMKSKSNGTQENSVDETTVVVSVTIDDDDDVLDLDADGTDDEDKSSDVQSERTSDAELARKCKSLTRQRTMNKNMTVDQLEHLKADLLRAEESNWALFTTSEAFIRLVNIMWYCEQPIELDQFNIFRDLGRGAFGVVAGAKFRATGALLALKCMNKKLVKGKNALKLVKTERDVLAKLGEHPSTFTVYVQYAFTDRDNFYLALPLCSGGDLQYHLAVERYFEPERARYHIAEVVLGIEHLHSLGIVYRDLKPDNILLDENGHCRISDMGLAIVTNGRHLRGRAGTPGYWAPEMLTKKRYSFPVDWWSLGCVLYELLSGRCPFSKLNTKMERDEATLQWEITYPEKLGCGVGGEVRPFPDDAKAFLERLLVRDKNKRLGASERGAEEVKEDTYFTGLDWAKLARKDITPPWVPKREQIHAFNQSDLDGKANEHDYRKIKLTPEDDLADFDYTSSLKHEEDLVEVLKLEDEGKLTYLQRGDQAACCTLS